MKFPKITESQGDMARRRGWHVYRAGVMPFAKEFVVEPGRNHYNAWRLCWEQATA